MFEQLGGQWQPTPGGPWLANLVKILILVIFLLGAALLSGPIATGPCSLTYGQTTNSNFRIADMGNPIDVVTFLARARDRFGERYDYTNILYKSYKTPIKIRCNLHPVRQISITPERHLQTTGGCKYCLRVSRNQVLERTLRLESDEPEFPLSKYLPISGHQLPG